MSDVKKFNELYKELAKIDINKDGYISWKDTGKGKSLGYLQWAIAEELFLSVYDDYDFIIRDFGNGKNYYADETGAYVETTIIAKKDGVEYKKTQQLQILDAQNEPQKLVNYEIITKYGNKTIQAFTMDDVENTIQRCKVKNFHQFGLGASLYQGKIKSPKQQPEVVNSVIDISMINECINNVSLQEVHYNLTAQQMKDYGDKNKWTFTYNDKTTGQNKTYKVSSKTLQKQVGNWLKYGLKEF
jgi:hypothetical protein